MAALFTTGNRTAGQKPWAKSEILWGDFIYVMDACLDQASDQKHGRYNPVAEFERVNGRFDGGLTLTMLIGDCSLAFERLPLEQDLDLLRNILYSGVWSKWAAARKQDSTHLEEKPHD